MLPRSVKVARTFYVVDNEIRSMDLTVWKPRGTVDPLLAITEPGDYSGRHYCREGQPVHAHTTPV